MFGAETVLSSTSLPPTPGIKLSSAGKGAGGTRVAEMAKEFEATFLSLLLKEMRQTLEPEGLFPGDSGDIQGGLFDLYMGRHLADSGGVGLATALVRQIEPGGPAKPGIPSNAATSSYNTRGVIPQAPPL